MIGDFLADIQRLKKKAERKEAVLQTTPEQEAILYYISSEKGGVTREQLRATIAKGNILDKQFSTSIGIVMDYIMDSNVDTISATSAVFWYLNYIEQFEGPKEAGKMAKIFFREVGIGLSPKEIRLLLEEKENESKNNNVTPR